MAPNYRKNLLQQVVSTTLVLLFLAVLCVGAVASMLPYARVAAFTGSMWRRVSAAQAPASFTASPTSGTAPLTVHFGASNLNVGNLYFMSFGDDGSTQLTLNAPPCARGVDCSNFYTAQSSHTYITAGTYAAQLLRGCATSSSRCSTPQIVVSTVTIVVDVN